jgi:hypothetical protein
MVISVIKIFLVIVILAAMVMILLGMNCLLRGDFSTIEEDEMRMRSDLENNRDVITKDSVFHEFVRSKEVNSDQSNENLNRQK